jgi:hypothetical protein
MKPRAAKALAAAIMRGAMPALTCIFVGTRFGPWTGPLRKALGAQRPTELKIQGQLAAAWHFRRGIVKAARVAPGIPFAIEKGFATVPEELQLGDPTGLGEYPGGSNS